MEVIVVIAIFGLVLTGTYQVLVTTLEAEQLVEDLNREGKAGQAILALIRRDLQSCAYHKLGRQVFLGVDFGDDDEAEDALHFLTYAPVPAPRDGVYDEWSEEVAAVGYVIKRGDENGNTLFRHVKWELDNQPFEDGSYTPIYEHVKGFSVRYFDGVEWFEEWDSLERIPDPDTLLDGEPPPVVDEDPDSEEPEPVPLPRAVEIELNLFLSDERGLKKNAAGEPIVEKHTMVIPIIAMDYLILEKDGDGDPDENN